MKLFYTPNSPYSRIARVTALELQIDVQFIEVTVRDKVDKLLHYNPAAKVPTLEMDDGTILSETHTICSYFQSLCDNILFATVDEKIAIQNEGIVNGFLDGVAVWVREARRVEHEKSPNVINLEKNRSWRCLDYLEAFWDCDQQSVRYSSIMLASALELMETRVMPSWKIDHPRLGAWYEKYSERLAMKKTKPFPV